MKHAKAVLYAYGMPSGMLGKYIAVMKGGSRPGVGRKSYGERVTITIRINDLAYNSLQRLMDEWQLSQSRTIEELLLIERG